ncbi:ChbG/HpnK family deacetylase [Edwardsiella tarda]|uniref:ChbG/HpnK family deacetylase n=1 Tax=Edwardsiella tarda TaxID=636 RepID=UPI003F65972F
MNRVLINADDFGYSESVNKAVDYCFMHNIINSATILPNMSGTLEAISIANNKKYHVGCHINLIEGVPFNKNILSFSEFSHDGKTLDFNIRRSSLRLSKEMIVELKKEMMMQLSFLYDHHVIVSHIDSHQHTHTIFPILQALIDVAEKFNLKIRLPRTTGSNFLIKKIYKKIISNYMIMRKVNFSEVFINYDEIFLTQTIYRDKICEVMVHPDLSGGSIVCSTTGLVLVDNYDFIQ